MGRSKLSLLFRDYMIPTAYRSVVAVNRAVTRLQQDGKTGGRFGDWTGKRLRNR